MSIQLTTERKISGGVKGRKILNIKALQRSQVPDEYFTTGKVVVEGYNALKEHKALFLYEPCKLAVGGLSRKCLFAVGDWIPEHKYQAKVKLIERAGEVLAEINDKILQSWPGKEVLLVTASVWAVTNLADGDELGKVDCNSINVWLYTLKSCNGKRERQRVLDKIIIQVGRNIRRQYAKASSNKTVAQQVREHIIRRIRKAIDQTIPVQKRQKGRPIWEPIGERVFKSMLTQKLVPLVEELEAWRGVEVIRI